MFPFILLVFGVVLRFLRLFFPVLMLTPLVWFAFFYPRRRCITWIEIHDQSWCPSVIRSPMIEVLIYFWSWCFWGSYGGRAAEDIRQAVRENGTKHVLEVCSGAGGGIQGLFKLLDDPSIRVTLTDLYPSPDIWAALAKKQDNLDYISKPVNALNIDPKLRGLRLIRGAMHHFTPEMVQSLVQDAVDKNQPFCSLDVPTDRLGQIQFWITAIGVGILCLPLLISKRIREGKYIQAVLLFFGSPVFGIAGMHDSLVSALRAYHPSEFEEICSRVKGIEKFNVRAYKSEGCIIQGNIFLATPRES